VNFPALKKIPPAARKIILIVGIMAAAYISLLFIIKNAQG
jgi:hypothetical protein